MITLTLFTLNILIRPFDKLRAGTFRAPIFLHPFRPQSSPCG